MFDMKWVLPPDTTTERPRLMYRYVQPTIDIGGNLCPGDWTDWHPVPLEVVSRAEFEAAKP